MLLSTPAYVTGVRQGYKFPHLRIARASWGPECLCAGHFPLRGVHLTPPPSTHCRPQNPLLEDPGPLDNLRSLHKSFEELQASRMCLLPSCL